jgi:hypothetical protein
MSTLILTLATLLLRDEAALRESYSKDIQAKEAAARVAAVKKLAGAKEHKTIELLAGSLKDAELEVRKAAAETLEGVSDAGGAAVKPLGEVLVDKKSEAFPHYLKTITSIEPEERQFHKFGFEVTQILDKYVGKSFGAGKTTGERWEEWWTDNKAALAQADSKRREAWKKTQ